MLYPNAFKTGMKIVVTNTSGKDLQVFFYDIDYTLHDKLSKDDLYFHAHFQHEDPTTLQRDFEILSEVAGRGRYLGSSLGVEANRELYGKKWWGEGEGKIYLDGDRESPTLAGTGTEDYVGAAWALGQFANMYQGAPYADSARMQYSLYRIHVSDPVYFHKQIRVTIQQIGILFGKNPEDPIYTTGTPCIKLAPIMWKFKTGSSPSSSGKTPGLPSLTSISTNNRHFART